MTNDVLNTLRHDINEIDSDLLVLLAKRRRISHGVVEYKIANNKPIRDEAREQASAGFQKARALDQRSPARQKWLPGTRCGSPLNKATPDGKSTKPPA